MNTKRVAPADRGVVVGYCRVSTDEQSLGPEGQKRAMERWCGSQGARLVAIHEDHGVSGGAPPDRRPGLLGALQDLRAHGAGVLLVAKRDRLARDVVIATLIERLAEREGARVMTADGSGNGEGPEHELLKGILDVFAQHERAIIRARTRTALGVKKSRGERVGGIPFGFKLAADEVHIVEDDGEQRILTEILALREAGYSMRGISARLNALDRPARGSRWHETSVARLLRRSKPQ